jgi:hypothetical protein
MAQREYKRFVNLLALAFTKRVALATDEFSPPFTYKNLLANSEVSKY